MNTNIRPADMKRTLRIKPWFTWTQTSCFPTALMSRAATTEESTPPERARTIERVFADAKGKYGVRYTFYRGLAQVYWVDAAPGFLYPPFL